jgi:hypothetical protein
MSCHPCVTAWTTRIHTRLPPLTKPQATVVALWSLGMGLARSCALTAVSAFLATWLHRKADTVRQQWRACCSAAPAQRGTARQALVVATCFVPLLAWVVDQWEGTPLALALAATTLGTRFPVLALRGISRGWALPGAWTGMVLAARGVYARWLLRRPTRLGGHPFVRRNTGGTLRPQGHGRAVPLKTLPPIVFGSIFA